MRFFKKSFFLFCLLAVNIFAIAQQDSSATPETTKVEVVKHIPKPIRKPIVKKDSTIRTLAAKSIKDTSAANNLNKLVKDSSQIRDSLLFAQKKVDAVMADSTKKSLALLADKKDTSSYRGIFGGAFIPINLRSVALMERERNAEGKELMFYILVGLVAVVAFTRALFPKYFTNIFSLLFQKSYRQKQAIEQITNSKISSLLLNLVFITSLAFYVTILLDNKGLIHIKFWQVLLYSLALVGGVYLFKYVFLNFIGWVFNERKAMESYTFVVFLSNKITAILLIPFLFVLSFTGGEIAAVGLIATYCLLGVVLLYRYFVAMSSLRNELSFHPVHFFLYLCVVEILPLLLIFKAVFNLIATRI